MCYVTRIEKEKMSVFDCPNLESLKLDKCSDPDIESLLGKQRIVSYMKMNEVAHTDDRKSAIQGYVNEIERLQHIIRKLRGEEVPSSPSSTTATIDDSNARARDASVLTNGWWLRHLRHFPSVAPFAQKITATGGRKIVNSRRRGAKMARTCRKTRRRGGGLRPTAGNLWK
jgi:hypothetical protein